MFRLVSLQPEDLEITPYTSSSGQSSLRIFHKPTTLLVQDESGADYHKTRDRLLKELDQKVQERQRQQSCGDIVAG
jgi:protein subunit release factor A